MRFYNVDIRGKFITQRVSSVPADLSEADKGRIIYSESDDQMYFHTGSGGFKSFSFDTGTIMLFGNNSAPVGWTRKSDWQDSAMFTFKASGSIGNGGAVNPTSTHTHSGPSHTHSMQNHTHSMQGHTHSGPSHQHSTSGHVLTTAELPSHSHTYCVDSYYASGEYWWSVSLQNTACASASNAGQCDGTPSTGTTGSGSSHSHGNTGSGGTGATGGPSSANTGSPSNNTTTAAGTGATGANTAPYYQQVIAAEKD